MKPMQARYNIFCNESGGAHDDTISTGSRERWLLVVNAGNAIRCGSFSKRSARGGRALENRHGD